MSTKRVSHLHDGEEAPMEFDGRKEGRYAYHCSKCGAEVFVRLRACEAKSAIEAAQKLVTTDV